MTAWTEDFERHRSLLFSIAYRMLGSVAESEDVVQEAYLRWREVPEGEVRSPKSYLSAVVTRLSIYRLRSARRVYRYLATRTADLGSRRGTCRP